MTNKDRGPFWDGFLSVFRHPVVIYCFGFTAGFVVCTILEIGKAMPC